ncbi:MAG: glycosyltransferase family 39 protein [Myxococcales bacterium]|nr:glycosyltransferase family 39 protein [Myxococcales bacterium]
MDAPVASPETLSPVRARRLPMGLELALVVLVATALLLPGIWRYSLVDPWETHYGEVARRMLNDHDWVHTDWQNEGFRSKPVLTFWLMASSMRALGHGEDGGYSGEMTSGPSILLAIRLPFVLLAVMGLTLMWFMLARLVNRRAAWLSLLTIGTCPFFFMIARQGITDMTLVALLLGAFSMFLLASEDGDGAIRPLGRLLRLGPNRAITWDARAVAFVLVGGFILVQAVYYFWYFQIARFPVTGFRVPPIRQPGFVIALPMVLGAIYVFAPSAYKLYRAVHIWVVLLIMGRPNAWAEARRLGAPGFFSYPLAGLILAVQAISGERGGWALAHRRAQRFADVAPLAKDGQIYLIFFWAFIGVSVLGKGIPGLGIAGVCCALFVIFQNRWARLIDGGFEIKRGIVLLLIIVLPWHVAMWLREGPLFISEWIFTHNLNRAAAGVHGDRGTFDYCFGQVGYGMMVWAALVPMALAGAAFVPAANLRVARVRFMIAAWAIAAATLFSLSQTKFHHYIFPAVPAMAILVALWLDDVLAGRVKPSWVIGAFGAAVVLLLARDMMHEEKQWIEMYIYRYDRPWPSNPPYGIDTSDAFLVIGLAGAAAVLLLGTRWKRTAVVAIGATALGTALWAMHVYMPIAGQHWGMRDAVARYYRERHIYGQQLVYANARQFVDDWAPVIKAGRTSWEFDTVVPENFLDGQPMTVRIQIQGLPPGQAADAEFVARGTGTVVGEHTIRIDFAAGQLGPIAAAVERHKRERRIACAPRPRPGRVACAYRIVDADRLIAWQLYWRGENFWSGDEIWGPIPEMKTAVKETDNVAFLRYLNDRAIAPEGRTYYVVTEAGRPPTLKTVLPTQTARETVQVIDTTSNKFSLAVFQL